MSADSVLPEPSVTQCDRADYLQLFLWGLMPWGLMSVLCCIHSKECERPYGHY